MDILLYHWKYWMLWKYSLLGNNSNYYTEKSEEEENENTSSFSYSNSSTTENSYTTDSNPFGYTNNTLTNSAIQTIIDARSEL